MKAKLVRDYIPSIISNNGDYFYTRKLKPDEFITALKEKLVEESVEVGNAKNVFELKNELADVKEVMFALAKACELDFKYAMIPSNVDAVNIARKLFEEAYDIKKVTDKEELKRRLNNVSQIINRLMEVNNIDYQDVEDVRLEKQADRGSFDKRVLLIDTMNREEYAQKRGCKTCVNRNCTHNWYLLNGEYDENGEPVGKYCIDYVSNYRQVKK